MAGLGTGLSYACGQPAIPPAPATTAPAPQATPPAAPAPTAAGSISAKEFAYTTSYKPSAGSQIISLTNDGAQTHEVTVVEFKDGKGPV